MAVLLFSALAGAQQYKISTVAGGAPPADPEPGARGPVFAPSALAVDTTGNVYFAGSLCVWKLDARGVVTRVAGNGKPGYSGDGGPAIDAQLSPTAVAVDSQGNLLIADVSTYRIRKVSPGGIITTLAGNGLSYQSAGDGGPAVLSLLVDPQSIVVDGAGNIIVAELQGRIRKIAPDGIVTTLAGSAESGYLGDGGQAAYAQFRAPDALALDAQGNIYIADQYNYRVRKISTAGTIATVAGTGIWGTLPGDGTARNTPLGSVSSIAVDRDGNLFIAERDTNRIRKVSADGKIATVAGGTQGYSGDGGPAVLAQFNGPSSVAVDSIGNLFVADQNNHRVRKISIAGTITTIAGTGDGFNPGDGGAAVNTGLSTVTYLAADTQGNLFISDCGNGLIRKVTADGVIRTVAGGGMAPPVDGIQATSAVLQYPKGVAVDSKGNLFIGSTGRILKVSPGGILTVIAGNGSQTRDGVPAVSSSVGSPEGLAVDGQGSIFFVDSSPAQVRKISAAGIISTVAGPGISGSLAPQYPRGLAVDTQGNLFIADMMRILKVTPAGAISSVAGNGTNGSGGDGGPATSAQLTQPWGLAIDSRGNLFAADTLARRIRRISGGTIATVAGGDAANYSGDGGPAARASFFGPWGMAADGQGNLFVSDADPRYGVSAVRRLQPTSSNVLIGAVTDAASQSQGVFSPGKIVVIYGAGLGPAYLVQAQSAGGVFPKQVAGTSVTFDGVSAPVLYTMDSQVAAVVPYSVSAGSVSVVVTYQGEASPAVTIAVAPVAPSLFTLNQSGAGHAAAINAADMSINTPLKPVKVGGYLSLFATGEGATTPAGEDGKIASGGLPQPAVPVSVTIDGLPAVVQYAGAAPGSVAGLMQVNVQVPAAVRPGGFVPIVMQVGSASTVPGALWVAVSGN